MKNFLNVTTEICDNQCSSQVIQCVYIEDTEVRVEESFINFIQFHGKSDIEITEQICENLQADSLKLEHYYAQMIRAFANGPGDQCSISGRVIPKIKKKKKKKKNGTWCCLA